MGGAKKLVSKASKIPGVNFAANNFVGGRLLQGKKLIGNDISKRKVPGVGGDSVTTMGGIEKRYGIERPQYESLRDESGALKSQFAYDPSKSAAFSKLREQAMAQPGDSPWAKMQLEKQGLEQSGARDQAAQSALQGVAQQQSNLARFGGISGGARERLAASGARGLARSQQDVARQGMMDRLGITEQDIGRQQSALGAVGQEELTGQAKNIGALTGDVSGKSSFDMERYKEQMQAMAADKTANAQRAAAQAAKPKGFLGGLFG